MNIVQERVLRQLRQQAIIIDIHETISIRGTKIPNTIDGRRTLEVLMEGVNLEAYSSGIRQAQQKFNEILSDDTKTRKLITAAANLSRIDDLHRLRD